MIEIRITLGADSSLTGLADRLLQLLHPAGSPETRTADAPQPAPQAADAPQPAPVETAVPEQSPAAPETPAAPQGPAQPEPQQPRPVSLADIREVLGPKNKELKERYGPDRTLEMLTAVFRDVGAPETNTASIPPDRRGEFIEKVRALQ